MAAVPKPSFGRLSGRGKSGSRRRDDADNATPRTAAPAGRDDTDDHGGEDQELSSYLKALAPDNDVESTGSGRKFGDAQVYQLRMTHAAGEELTELAEARGTSPQALALEWVLERLAWEAGSVTPTGTDPAAPGQDAAASGADQPAGHQNAGFQNAGFQDAGLPGDGFPAAPQAEQVAPAPEAHAARPGEDTDPHGRAVPPLGAGPDPRHAAGPGHIEPEARTDEHFFDRTGWDAPRR
ncbi:hypothetical protein LY15_003021 [Prauserella flava]|nr:hypothetical protein [Prauserella flava]MCR3734885.1 hypothetical protein [Prauserella salsuginis]